MSTAWFNWINASVNKTEVGLLYYFIKENTYLGFNFFAFIFRLLGLGGAGLILLCTESNEGARDIWVDTDTTLSGMTGSFSSNKICKQKRIKKIDWLW